MLFKTKKKNYYCTCFFKYINLDRRVLSNLRSFPHTAESLMAVICVCISVYMMPRRDSWFVFLLNLLEKTGTEKKSFSSLSRVSKNKCGR